jgi:hypothetical protein
MAAVPDSRWDVSDVLADGDRVAIRISWSGTYLGAHFRGWSIAAPAKFAVEHMHIYRVAGGKLAEHWVVQGRLGNAAATWSRSPLGCVDELSARAVTVVCTRLSTAGTAHRRFHPKCHRAVEEVLRLQRTERCLGWLVPQPCRR